MNNSTIVFLINDDVRAIKATYEDGGSADTFKTLDQSIKVDDLVVVQSGTRHEMTVVKVTEADVDLDLDTNASIKWIIQKIDGDSFNLVLEQEAEAIAAVQSAERARKKAELRKSVFADQTDRISTLKLANHADDDLTE